MFYTMSFGLEKIQSYTFMMMGSLMYGVSQFILREIIDSKSEIVSLKDFEKFNKFRIILIR